MSETLGRYVLDRRLATGGMAEVFLAKQSGPEGFEKLCVVKRMLPDLSDDQVFVGMFLDGVSIFLIFVPLLWPIVQFYKWDPVWFGVILTLKVALGQFTPPLAVNLMVSCRIANVRMEETVRWVGPMLFSMFLVMVAVIIWPELALWLPRYLGY